VYETAALAPFPLGAKGQWHHLDEECFPCNPFPRPQRVLEIHEWAQNETEV
jgi:hypothetical protein